MRGGGRVSSLCTVRFKSEASCWCVSLSPVARSVMGDVRPASAGETLNLSVSFILCDNMTADNIKPSIHMQVLAE